jgi:hypothetical protein
MKKFKRVSNMSKKILSLLFVMLLMAAVAACGSDDNASSSTTSSARPTGGASSVAATNSTPNTSAESGVSSADEPVLEATSEQPTGDIQDPIFAFEGAAFMPSDKFTGDEVPAGVGNLATGAAGNLKFKADVASAILAIDGYGSKTLSINYVVGGSGAQTANGAIWFSPDMVNNAGRDYFTFWFKGSTNAKDIIFSFGAPAGTPSPEKPSFKFYNLASKEVFDSPIVTDSTDAASSNKEGWFLGTAISGSQGASYNTSAPFNRSDWVKIYVKLPKNSGTGVFFDGCGAGAPLQIRTGSNNAYDLFFDFFQYEDSRHAAF